MRFHVGQEIVKQLPFNRPRKRKADAVAGLPGPGQPTSVVGTPLRIPFANKDVALKLGARYRSDGRYAPLGVDLSAASVDGYNARRMAAQCAFEEVKP
jgi:DNA topoisomerase-3